MHAGTVCVCVQLYTHTYTHTVYKHLVHRRCGIQHTGELRGNAIDSKISTYTDEITDYEDELAKLETAMETTRARYVEQFAAMESAVSSFRKTGEYLDNFMESWKAGLG